MNQMYMAIRKLTVAPVMALLMLLVFRIFLPGVFRSEPDFVLALLFLTAFPLLAYPLQKHIPAYRDRGREGQRSLAMLFAASGYILGLLSSLLTRASRETVILYLEYLISGLLILIFNKILHIRLSGHAADLSDAGMTLPVTIPDCFAFQSSYNNGSAVYKKLLAGLICLFHLFEIFVKSFYIRVADFKGRTFYVSPFLISKNSVNQFLYQ